MDDIYDRVEIRILSFSVGNISTSKQGERVRGMTFKGR